MLGECKVAEFRGGQGMGNYSPGSSCRGQWLVAGMVMWGLQEGRQSSAVPRVNVRQSPSAVRTVVGRQRSWEVTRFGQRHLMAIPVIIYYCVSPGSVAWLGTLIPSYPCGRWAFQRPSLQSCSRGTSSIMTVPTCLMRISSLHPASLFGSTLKFGLPSEISQGIPTKSTPYSL